MVVFANTPLFYWRPMRQKIQCPPDTEDTWAKLKQPFMIEAAEHLYKLDGVGQQELMRILNC